MASNNIKGITIEIGANTTEFSKAMKETNSEINGTQKSLKEVNKLLKLDPKNTELLAQKQQLLAKGVEETKKKLDILHQAEKKLKDNGVDENTEEFQKLRRQIIEAEQSLDQFKDTGKSAKDVLSGIGSTVGNVASGIGKGLAAAATAAAAGVTALAAGVSQAIEKSTAYADEVDKASIRMGMSAEAYQELAYASGQCGVEMSVMEKAAKKLEGTDISMEDAMSQIMAMETAEERAAKAAEFFGETVAYNMSPLIEQSSDSYDDLINRSHELGLVMSSEDVSAGVVLGDTIADIKASLEMVVVQLGAKLTPII